jgi:hypothetical protein
VQLQQQGQFGSKEKANFRHSRIIAVEFRPIVRRSARRIAARPWARNLSLRNGVDGVNLAGFAARRADATLAADRNLQIHLISSLPVR